MQSQYPRAMSMQESMTKLELFISCRSLANMDTFSKSDPFIVMQVKKNNKWMEFGRTETIMDNLNPNFQKSFQIDYYFEVQQHLNFLVYDYDSPTSSDFIGSVETTLSAIAGSKDQVQLLDLINNGKKTGKIIIRADEVKMVNDKISMTLRGESLDSNRWFSSPNPFLRFYRLRKDDSQYILVYETEHVAGNKSPNWKQINIPSQKLCNGEYQMPLKIEAWDYHSNGNHEYIGELQITVNELRSQQNLRRTFKNKHKNKNVGQLQVQMFKLVEKPSFMQYIGGGTQLNLVLAIDFTASNQNPQHPSSLHYLDPKGQLNQYQQAIINVGEILLNYDHDQKIPVFGFGCKTRLPNMYSAQTLHCFPLNGNSQEPEVFGLPGIMQAYSYVLPQVQFDGPTFFNPIISETMKLCQMCKDMASDTYFILLILTDGEIHDMKESINSVIAASDLPLSIIIIGVGNADFHNMEVLDNDDGDMRDSQGRKAKRDIVQFVPFNEYKNNPELLAKNVLQELPDQLVEYMMLMGKKPGQHNQVNIDDIVTNVNQPGQQPQQPPVQQPYQAQQLPSNFLIQQGPPIYNPQSQFPQYNYPQQGYQQQQQQFPYQQTK